MEVRTHKNYIWRLNTDSEEYFLSVMCACKIFFRPYRFSSYYIISRYYITICLVQWSTFVKYIHIELPFNFNWCLGTEALQKAVEERADATEKLDELIAVAKQYEEAQKSVADYKQQLEDYILKVKIPLPSQN